MMLSGLSSVSQFFALYCTVKFLGTLFYGALVLLIMLDFREKFILCSRSILYKQISQCPHTRASQSKMNGGLHSYKFCGKISCHSSCNRSTNKRHDFIYKLKKCKNYVNEVAQQALMSAIKHLWYLTPKLIILCLFDDKVPIRPKSGVCRSLHSFPRLFAYTPGKPGHPNF